MEKLQTNHAQELYDERGETYDDSHHPRFARHMVQLIQLQPGEHVLDLACGTGLVTFPASEAVGETGSVTGVDISNGMLAVAKRRRAKYHVENVAIYQHSISDLDSLNAIKGFKFDVVTCCSALVLLPEPAEALRQWATYLEPGGRLIVDVTHPQNLTSGIVLEKVGQIVGCPVPWHRLNFQKPEDLSDMMEAAGLRDVNIIFMSQLGEGPDDLEHFIRPSFSDPKVHEEFEISDADRIFDKLIDRTPAKSLASPPEIREKARVAFREEWARAANSKGKVQEIDGIFMGIGYKS